MDFIILIIDLPHNEAGLVFERITINNDNSNEQQVLERGD